MGKRGLTSYLCGTVLMAGTAMADCDAGTLALRGDFGEVRFSVDVADDASERAQGLMFVEEMGTFEGMLFVFEAPQTASFWMRNTLIPLDMVFIGADGVVDHIHENAVPLDETPIFGGDDIQYVLEVNGGLSARLGLSVGDEVQHPSVAGDVLWPCD